MGGGSGGGGGMSGAGGGGGMGAIGMTYDMNRRVINLMQVGGPQQVQLGVTVAEMSTRLARNLTVNFSAFGGGDIRGGAIDNSGLINAISAAADGAATVYNPAALFLRFAGSDATVRTFINAARENGLAKVLAEPNLTAVSGMDAEFQSGGSFPVPVFNFAGGGGAGGGANVQFKDYGVILKFLPVVLDTNRISLKVNITVSELSDENAVSIPQADGITYTIPSLLQRGAATTLELDSGQTMGIAGLINDRTRSAIKKFPGLGDIPVLGQLFTSQQFQRQETELMILVTPQLAKPVDQRKLRLPTDDYVEPTDSEFYWMGRNESLVNAPDRPSSQQDNMGGLRGHFGPKIQNMRRDAPGN
jgi:pilus assembly protein CpaC